MRRDGRVDRVAVAVPEVRAARFPCGPGGWRPRRRRRGWTPSRPRRTSSRARLFRDVDSRGRASGVRLHGRVLGLVRRAEPRPGRLPDGERGRTLLDDRDPARLRVRDEDEVRDEDARGAQAIHRPVERRLVPEDVREEERDGLAGARGLAAGDRLQRDADPLPVEARDDAEHSGEAHGEVRDLPVGGDDGDELLPVEDVAALEVEVPREEDAASASSRESPCTRPRDRARRRSAARRRGARGGPASSATRSSPRRAARARNRPRGPRSTRGGPAGISSGSERSRNAESCRMKERFRSPGTSAVNSVSRCVSWERIHGRVRRPNARPRSYGAPAKRPTRIPSAEPAGTTARPRTSRGGEPCRALDVGSRRRSGGASRAGRERTRREAPRRRGPRGSRSAARGRSHSSLSQNRAKRYHCVG